METGELARLYKLAEAGDESAERALLRWLRRKHGEAAFTKREACVRLLDKIRSEEDALRGLRDAKAGPWAFDAEGGISCETVMVKGKPWRRYQLQSEIDMKKHRIRMCYALRAFLMGKPYVAGESTNAHTWLAGVSYAQTADGALSRDLELRAALTPVFLGMWDAVQRNFTQDEAEAIFGVEHEAQSTTMHQCHLYRQFTKTLRAVVSVAFDEWLGSPARHCPRAREPRALAR